MKCKSNGSSWSVALLLGFLNSVSLQCVAEEWTYTVKPGENIWTISEHYLTSVLYWKKLQALNHLKDPLHIPPGTLIKIPVKWLDKSPMVARLQSVVGSVTIIEEFTGTSHAVSEGEYIFKDDIVGTGADSTATIQFIDGSTLLLQPNSHLKFDNVDIYPGTGMTDTQLRLKQGRIETHVTPRKGEASRFEISTPAGVTSVRGTNYRVSAESETTESRTEVVTGKVAVASQGTSRLIHQGFGTVTGSSFQPKIPIKLLEAPTLESLPDIVERLPIQFKVNDLDLRHSFRVQLSPLATFETVIFDQVFQGNVGRLIDFPDGHYFLRVRSIDENLLEGFNAEHELTLNVRPEAPFLIEPKPDAGVPLEMPHFVWAQLQSAQNYHFQMATDVAFKNLLVDTDGLAVAEYLTEAKLGLGQYYWRVASKNDAEGLGPFSDPQSFRRVLPAPEANDPEVSDTEITMRWRAGLAGQKYQFQMAKEASFTDPLIDTVTDHSELILERPEGGDYFVRVRIIESDGFIGPYGEAQAITIPSDFNYWWLLALPLLGLIAL